MRFIYALVEGFAFALGFFVVFPVVTLAIRLLTHAVA
jgi:hypothetical protein